MTVWLWWESKSPNYGPSADERREQMSSVEYQSWRNRGPKRHDCVEKPDCDPPVTPDSLALITQEEGK